MLPWSFTRTRRTALKDGDLGFGDSGGRVDGINPALPLIRNIP